MTLDSTVPQGFEPIFRTSPFLDLCGPLFYKHKGAQLIFGLRIAEKHANARGLAHGGLLTTFADISLGYALAYSTDPPGTYVTVHMDLDFAGAARIGDWLEARVDIQKRGSRMAFANAYLSVGEQRVVRASAVFAAQERPADTAAPRLPAD